ncbi:unnamed protein product [Acanthoscelides obtectus]|uniref:DDE Tnp4 domain-containing protein n=1 Tax=Acanthoscelides obtectus TaxID=200917 RepID=A0A9P0JUY0_ACAOB|nr:unnamed protein product [Acanthoscelides obtectus]CAK1647982.1 Putative nuclease HARBI1 [Acanthoscelides obtectus]
MKYAQVVCDHKRRIRDIFVDYPGSVHDSRVLRTSPLHANLPDKCGQYYILGDSGYPCLRYLLTPFRDNGHLTRRQKNYNYILSFNRYIIEHCFDVLKQKFRKLYHLKFRVVAFMVHFIRACAVLHNLFLSVSFTVEQAPGHPNVPRQHIFSNEDFQPDSDDRDGQRVREEVM